MNQMKLCDVAEVLPGYPFRSKIKVDSEATTRVIQLRDVNAEGHLNYYRISNAFLTGKKKPDWISLGDLLFTAKGQRHTAVYVSQVLAHTVCAPQFFHVRIKPEYQQQISSLFLAWQLNQGPCQQYFQKQAEGSIQPHIRKPILEQTPVSMPSLAIQSNITDLYLLVLQEKQVLETLERQRQHQLSAIAANLSSFE